jgi:hypothetical protein
MFNKYNTNRILKRDKPIVDAVIAGRMPLTTLVDKTLTGADFNKIYPNTKFIKQVSYPDMEYYAGLNKSIKQFTSGYAGKGLTFIKDNGSITHLRYVSIPDNARVYVENNDEFRCDTFILSDVIYPKEQDTTIEGSAIRPLLYQPHSGDYTSLCETRIR